MSIAHCTAVQILEVLSAFVLASGLAALLAMKRRRDRIADPQYSALP
jgi:hypothetical protein